MSEELIQVARLPVIEEHLERFRERWDEKRKLALSAVCTDETVGAVKAERAQMRKEYDEVFSAKKAVKDRYMEPWNRVEDIFLHCVKQAYEEADAAYRAQISAYEDAKKQKVAEEMKRYFDELCAVHNIQWLSFDRMRLNISLSASKSKLRDKIGEFTARVAEDVSAISALDDAAEILAEYKDNTALNMALAVRRVKERHNAAEAERKALEARKEEIEAQEAAKERVVSAVPVTEVPAEVRVEEERVICRLKLYATRPQLRELRSYLENAGIEILPEDEG